MPKNEARAERNRIRAHYEKKFSGRLKEKDDAIRHLLDDNQRLKDQVKALQAQLDDGKAAAERTDELVRSLQAMAKLSDEELEKAKADLGSKADAAKHMADIKRSLNALCGNDPYGTMGVLPGVLIGLLSDMKKEG